MSCYQKGCNTSSNDGPGCLVEIKHRAIGAWLLWYRISNAGWARPWLAYVSSCSQHRNQTRPKSPPTGLSRWFFFFFFSRGSRAGLIKLKFFLPGSRTGLSRQFSLTEVSPVSLESTPRPGGLDHITWLEKVYFSSLNSHQSSFFLPQLQNRTNHLPQLFKPCILPLSSGFEGGLLQ
jgi:hypothetical protein